MKARALCAHSSRQIFKDVIHSNARSLDAWLPATSGGMNGYVLAPIHGAYLMRFRKDVNHAEDTMGIATMVTLKCRSKLWLYSGPGGWHFITLPLRHANTIKSLQQGNRKGWGSIPVNATIGGTTWKTSIFPDKKSASYLLPVKADVRRKEDLGDGDTIQVTIEVKV